MSSVPSSASRIVSMDQFRGYTVAGMFLVNFVGGLAAFPEVLKHHNHHPYFSYADSIMPSFMFAVGFSYRLTTLRRLAQAGAVRAYGHILAPAWPWYWYRWCLPCAATSSQSRHGRRRLPASSGSSSRCF